MLDFGLALTLGMVSNMICQKRNRYKSVPNKSCQDRPKKIKRYQINDVEKHRDEQLPVRNFSEQIYQQNFLLHEGAALRVYF